jgi:hypothetical protein
VGSYGYPKISTRNIYLFDSMNYNHCKTKEGVIRYIDIHDIDEQPDNDVLYPLY